jgi:N-acetylglucosaminyl-diphospho-decaprenol L-rhamnosyltransferase
VTQAPPSSGSASLIIVNYRSAALAAQAVASARETTSSPLQIIVVDNSVDRRELALLERCGADVLLAAPANRGYGAGINLGRTKATGDVIVASNPDVIFHPGCIDLLARSLKSPIGISGPAFFWDDRLRWHLPPADAAGFSAALGTLLAVRSRWFRRRRDAWKARQRIAFWTAESPTLVPALSGAVLAIRRNLFDELGGFDERFFLYFEEHDLIRRAARHGWRSLYVPAARCRHLYNQSARSSPETLAHYETSERLFEGRGIGAAAARFVQRLGPRPRPDTFRESDSIEIEGRPEDFLVEASPLPGFETAAGHFPESTIVRVPPEVWTAYQDPVLHLRTVWRRTGQTVTTVVRKKHLELVP